MNKITENIELHRAKQLVFLHISIRLSKWVMMDLIN